MGDKATIDDLKARIAAGFSEFLAPWPAELRRRLDQLGSRVWPNSPKAPLSIAENFNPLTTFYPALQANGLVTLVQGSIDAALVAHLCLVLHAYISDRGEDGQLQLDDMDVQVLARLHGDALQLLRGLKPAGASIPELRRVFDSIGDRAGEFGCGSAEARLTDAADVSARQGFLATTCLLAYAGISAAHMRLAAMAYRHTVIAIQYIDDMHDWKEDLRLKNRNLLFGILADRAWRITKRGTYDDCEFIVAHALLRQRIYDVALERVSARFRAAILIQQRLGCRVLADHLARMAADIQDRAPKLIRSLENDVIVGYLIAPSVSRRL